MEFEWNIPELRVAGRLASYRMTAVYFAGWIQVSTIPTWLFIEDVSKRKKRYSGYNSSMASEKILKKRFSTIHPHFQESNKWTFKPFFLIYHFSTIDIKKSEYGIGIEYTRVGSRRATFHTAWLQIILPDEYRFPYSHLTVPRGCFDVSKRKKRYSGYNSSMASEKILNMLHHPP